MPQSPTDPKYQPGEPATSHGLPGDVIISLDTLRENRIPPGQSRTRKWPVLQAGPVMEITQQEWSLTIGGLVDKLHFRGL